MCTSVDGLKPGMWDYGHRSMCCMECCPPNYQLTYRIKSLVGMELEWADMASGRARRRPGPGDDGREVSGWRLKLPWDLPHAASVQCSDGSVSS